MVSDMMYDAQATVPLPYISSGTYYGYVPHCVNENQRRDYIDEERNVDHRHHHNHHHHHHATAMETDDDGCSAASNCLSKYSVIPETVSLWHNCRLEAVDDQQRYRQTQQQQEEQQRERTHAWSLRRRNRKRHSDGWLRYEPDVERKRFRKDGGNGCVYYGTGSTGNGLDQMHYESSSLWLDITNDIQPSEQPARAAGNSSLSNSDYKHLLSSNGPKSNKDNTDYEKMLFETHGSSTYQWRRLLDNDHIEPEF